MTDQVPQISLFPGAGSGLAKVIIAYAALISAGLGGIAGLVTAFSGAKTGDVRQARSAIVQRIDKQEERLKNQERNLEAVRKEVARKARDVDVALTNRRLEYVADWVCEENQGKPHASWPCHYVTWEPPPKGARTPIRRSNKPWPQLQD